MAQELLNHLPAQLFDLLPQGVASLAALHDVGKVSPGFQIKCEKWLAVQGLQQRATAEKWISCCSDHARVSQATVQKILANPKLDRWAAIIGAHHGEIKGERLSQVEPMWESERLRLASELLSEFGSLPCTPGEDAILWFVAGLISVADWIGSDEGNFPLRKGYDLETSRTNARGGLARIGWERPRIRDQMSFDELFRGITLANSLQETTISAITESGVYVVEAPMGLGKTEAALASAYHLMRSGKATGIYFALPTQLTSNRIHERVQKFVERIALNSSRVRLAHAASWLFDVDLPVHPPSTEPRTSILADARAARSWFASSKRALLASFGVGTIDQALLGIVAAKHFFVRQFGLAGKVVILDEIHTYDIYTGTLVERLVRRLRELQCTVIILSATLTESRRRELLALPKSESCSKAYPLVSGSARAFFEVSCDQSGTKVVHIRTSVVSPFEEVLERASQGNCVLWIQNTIDEAQATFRAVRTLNREDGPSVGLLHSRFPFFRREELENKWIDALGKSATHRPDGCVLISTQVAEQSVDIDADLLVTDLAPTDMLLQRIGRLWRHEGRARPSPQPEVWLRVPSLGIDTSRTASAREIRDAFGKSSYVYAPYILLRSLVEWGCRERIDLPGDIRSILEATYTDLEGEPASWKELRETLENERSRMARSAINATTIWHTPAFVDEEGVQTRWNSRPSALVLLARDREQLSRTQIRLVLLDGSKIVVGDREWDFDTAKKVHFNSVRVPLWAVSSVPTERWLESYAGPNAVVGRITSKGDIVWDEGSSRAGLAYDPDQGVMIDHTITGGTNDELGE